MTKIPMRLNKCKQKMTGNKELKFPHDKPNLGIWFYFYYYRTCSVGKWKIKQTKKMINGWITKKVKGLKNDSILQWTKGRNSIMLLRQEGNYMYCSSFKVIVCITFYTIRWNTIMFCNPKPGRYTSRTLLLTR